MWEGINAFFEPDEIIVARGTADMIDAIEMDDAQIHRIAAAGCERTPADQTSDRRARDSRSLRFRAEFLLCRGQAEVEIIQFALVPPPHFQANCLW
jgi:spore maturation protein CgeB